MRIKCVLAVATAVTLGAPGVADVVKPHVLANEAAAIMTLRAIAVAQEQFRADVACDVDHDGVGEFGLLRELAGRAPVRQFANGDYMTGAPYGGAPVLPPESYSWTQAGEVRHDGYLFRLFLPGTSGVGVAEESMGTLGASIDSDGAETTWCCYAWPEHYGSSGRRTFFVNQTRDISGADVSRYSGSGVFSSTNSGAALAVPGLAAQIVGVVADGERGRDGNLWERAPRQHDDAALSVRGRLDPVGSSALRGAKFELRLWRFGGETSDSTLVKVSAALSVPTGGEYRVVLVDPTGTTEVVVGTFVPSRRRRTIIVGWPSFEAPEPSARAVFGGGTFEVRLDGMTMLRGAIPRFANPVGAPTDAGGVSTYRAVADLAPPLEGAAGWGEIVASARSRGARSSRRIAVAVVGLDPVAGPYSVVALPTVGAEFQLGTIVPRGAASSGHIVLRGRRTVVVAAEALSGASIEVRDAANVTVLRGRLPDAAAR